MAEDIDKIRQQFNALLKLEADQMKQDIEFAESIGCGSESELILANRILENDCIA